MSRSSIVHFVPEVCEAIINEFRLQEMKIPHDAAEWRAIAEVFEKKWNMPHCLVAIDGKHESIIHPPRSGSLYFNYEKFFSFLLQGITDVNYKFLFVDICREPSAGDTQICKHCPFKAYYEYDLLRWPRLELE